MEIRVIIQLTYNIRRCLSEIQERQEDIAALHHNIEISNLNGDLFCANASRYAKIAQKESIIELQKQQIKQLIKQLNEQI
jgi:phosphotransferase system IIA component